MIKNIFLIGIDGAGRAPLNPQLCPNMHRVSKKGIIANNVRTVFPPISAQAWGSMFFSVMPKQHKLTNDFVVENENLGDKYPSLFKIVNRSYPNFSLASFSSWNGINSGIVENLKDCVKQTNQEEQLVKDAAAYIKSCDDGMFFLHLDEVDNSGHKYGYFKQSYFESLTKVDKNVGIILDAIEDAGKLEKSLIIILSDHGGGGADEYDHGSNLPSDMEIFIIASGGSLPVGKVVNNCISILDVTPFILNELNIDIPEYMVGNENIFLDRNI